MVVGVGVDVWIGDVERLGRQLCSLQGERPHELGAQATLSRFIGHRDGEGVFRCGFLSAVVGRGFPHGDVVAP